MPTRLNSRSLINVLPNLQPPSEVFRLGDIFNEATRGHYQSGATLRVALFFGSCVRLHGFRLPGNPKPGNSVFSAHSTNTSPSLTSWSPRFATPIASSIRSEIGRA